MKALELKEMEAIEGGRFLGRGKHSDRVGGAHDNASCAGGCSVTVHDYFTIFWVHAIDRGSNEECLAPNI